MKFLIKSKKNFRVFSFRVVIILVDCIIFITIEFTFFDTKNA